MEVLVVQAGGSRGRSRRETTQSHGGGNTGGLAGEVLAG